LTGSWMAYGRSVCWDQNPVASEWGVFWKRLFVKISVTQYMFFWFFYETKRIVKENGGGGLGALLGPHCFTMSGFQCLR
jgi:hypothetical protein